MEKQNQEYEQAEQVVRDKYDKMSRRIVNIGLFPFLGLSVLGVISYAGALLNQGMTKADLQNTPIYKEFQDNQNSLSYVREQLNQFQQNFPEYLSPEVKKDLSSIPLNQTDSAKISALEKAINTAKNDSSKIVNSLEYGELSEKIKENDKLSNNPLYKIFDKFLLTGVSFILGALGFESYQLRRKEREIKALKTKYGISQETQ